MRSADERLVKALADIDIGGSNQERIDLAFRLDEMSKIILLFNKNFERWNKFLKNHIEDRNVEFITDNEKKRHSLMMDDERAKMSPSRALWYILSHTYVVNENLGIQLGVGDMWKFAHPLSKSVVEIRIKTAQFYNLIEIDARRRKNIVKLTDSGKSCVSEHTTFLKSIFE